MDTKMIKELNKNIENKIKKLDSKAILLLGNLFLHEDYPHSFLTQKESAKILNCSNATAVKILKSLCRAGLIVEVKSYINFYFPVKDNEIRRLVLKRIGFWK